MIKSKYQIGDIVKYNIRGSSEIFGFEGISLIVYIEYYANKETYYYVKEICNSEKSLVNFSILYEEDIRQRINK